MFYRRLIMSQGLTLRKLILKPCALLAYLMRVGWLSCLLGIGYHCFHRASSMSYSGMSPRERHAAVLCATTHLHMLRSDRLKERNNCSFALVAMLVRSVQALTVTCPLNAALPGTAPTPEAMLPPTVPATQPPAMQSWSEAPDPPHTGQHSVGHYPSLQSCPDAPDPPSTDPTKPSGQKQEGELPSAPASGQRPIGELPSAPRFSHLGVLYNAPVTASADDEPGAPAEKPGKADAAEVDADLLERMRRLQQ
jgi:hypothetical protein